MRHARELATALRASLYLLHVVASDIGPGASELWGVDSGDLLERLEAKSKAELDQLRATLALDGVLHHAATRLGGEADSINDYAREQEGRAHVLRCDPDRWTDRRPTRRGRGGSGPSGVEYLLLGSVAEKVVRGAPCPVLVVRPTPPKS